MRDTENPGFSYATVNGSPVKPYTYPSLWHGTSEITKEIFIAESGLPKKGTDIELTRHVEPPPQRESPSAFRGTVQFPLSPDKSSGACLWAGDNGLIFHITEFPGYDVNTLLEGKILDGMGRYRAPLHYGEQEIAIPARVPKSYVSYIGRVVEGPRGPYHVMEKI